jgi:hypothetical protein
MASVKPTTVNRISTKTLSGRLALLAPLFAVLLACTGELSPGGDEADADVVEADAGEEPADGGATDAGKADSGKADAGALDAAVDAGATDAGTALFPRVRAIVRANCTNCHGNFNTDSQIAADHVNIAARVASGNMPKRSSLVAADKKTIADWNAKGGRVTD